MLLCGAPKVRITCKVKMPPAAAEGKRLKVVFKDGPLGLVVSKDPHDGSHHVKKTIEGGQAEAVAMAAGFKECVKLFEDEQVMVILAPPPFGPLAKGHSLLFPKEQYRSIEQMPEEVVAACFRCLPRLVRAIKTATQVDECTVVLEDQGTGAGIDEHVHWHIIPRREGDEVFVKDVKGGELSAAERALAEEAEGVGGAGGHSHSAHHTLGRLQQIVDEEEAKEAEELEGSKDRNSNSGNSGRGRGAAAATGFVSYERWRALQKLAQAIGDSRDTAKLKTLFEEFDTDHSGYLDKQEFRKMLEHYGKGVSDEQLTEVFDHFDRSGDGKIDLSEFIAISDEANPKPKVAKTDAEAEPAKPKPAAASKPTKKRQLTRDADE
eukprot:g1285.t1